MEVNKYGPRTTVESIAIWLHEILHISVVGVAVFFAISAMQEGPQFSDLTRLEARTKIEDLKPARASSLLNGEGPLKGQEAN